MKKLLVAALLCGLPVTSAHAFDINSYTYEPLLSYPDLRTALDPAVRARGVLYDPAVPGQLLVFAEVPGGDSWFLTWDMDDESVQILGGDSLDNLKGSVTTIVHGALGAGGGVIAYHDNAAFGTIAGMDVLTETYVADIITDTELENTGTLGYLSGDLWVAGQSIGGGDPADVQIIDTDAGTVTTAVTLNDMRDSAVVGAGEAIFADRWNLRLFSVTDLTGSPSSTEITPAGWGFPETRTIETFTALSTDLYAILDGSPSGFDDDIIAIWDGTSMTELPLSTIAPAGEIYPNFHTGMLFHQPDPQTLHLYIANFNNFANEPAIARLVWEDTTSVSDWLMF